MEDFLNIKKQEARLKILLEDFPEADKKLIRQALRLVKRKHRGQERDEGGPYVIHCIRVTCCLIEELKIKKPEVICAALLHDIIEDTDLDIDKILQKFGERTGKIVSALTRVKAQNETEQNRYERKCEHFSKIMQADREIRVVKACDWLDNVRSWPWIPEGHPSCEKFPRWFKEGENMYLPLARNINSKVAEKMKKALFEAKSNLFCR